MAAVSAGTAFVDVKGDFTSLNKQIAGANSDLSGKFGKMGKAAGVALAGGVAAAGIGKALFDVGAAFDDAYDTIRVGTGKTGKALEGLKGDFKSVVKGVPASFGDASKAVTELNQRLGLTGKPLQERSKQFLELSRITKTDVSANIKDVTRAFGDWEVKTGDQSKTLDKFFRAAQASGSSVGDLAKQVVQFGAPLRQVGFSLDEATAMFASFEKAGVNTSTMMPGLKMALKGFLAEGLDPKKELAATFKGIKDGSIETSAALKIFGARAGPDMVEAIKQGRFSLESMTKTLRDGKDTIRGAGKDTMDFGERWLMFKNKVLVKLEPIAIRFFDAMGAAMKVLPPIVTQVVAAIGTLLAPFIAVGKAIAGSKTAMLALGAASAVLLAAWAGFAIVGAIRTAIQGLYTAFWALNAAMAANPIGLVVVGLAALVAAFVVAYRESETFRDIINGAFEVVSTAFGWVLTAAQNAFGWLKDNWPLVLAILTGPIGLAVVAIKEFGPDLLDAAKWLLDEFVEGVKGAVSFVVGLGGWIVARVVEGIKAIAGFGADVGGWLKNRVVDGVHAVAEGFTGLGGWVVNRIVDGFKVVGDALAGIGGWLKNRVVEIVHLAADGFVDLGGWVLNRVVDGVKTVTEALGSVGGWLKNRLIDAFETVKDGFLGIGGSIIGWIVDGLKKGADKLHGFIQKIANIISSIPGVPDIKVPSFAGGGTVDRQAIVVPQFAGGGVVPVRLSPGERVDYGGKSWMVPGARKAADSVFAALPPGAQVFTGHGQALLAAGASPGQALASQRPHFGAGSIPGFRLGGLLDGLKGGVSSLWDLAKGGIGSITGSLPGLGDLPDWIQGTGSWILKRVTGWIKDQISSLFGKGGGLPGVMKAALARPPIGTPYVYGGGHGGSIAGGVDCSGGVSWALMGGNLIGGPMTTDGLKVFGEAGDGKAITVGVRGSTGRQAHTMMEIAGRFFESGSGHGWAETSGWSGNFPIHRHPPGLVMGGIVEEALARVLDPRIVGWGLREGGVLGSYAQGTDYVPRTGTYRLHRGESVTPVGGSSAQDIVDALREMDVCFMVGGQVIEETVDVIIGRKDRESHAEFMAGVV